MIRKLTLPILFIGTLSGFCFAQSTQAPTSGEATTSATQTASGSTGDSSTPNSNGNVTPGKKVWTNEDIKNASGRISVVGDKRNQKYTMTRPADQATVDRYRTSLKKLQGQLADVNKQLKSFQEFQQGKPVGQGGEDVSHGYSRTPVNQQIAKLQDKKKNLEDQMDALYDEARKKGIESGQLD